MIQCPEAHLFCKSCMTSYASNLLGEHNPNIVCMDQSGCKLPFPESELCRFLSSKLLELYYRVKQHKEIEAAGVENLEECPFCEYKCVIENEMEKLFRCENPECSAITCRMCKKPVSPFCLCSPVSISDVGPSRLTWVWLRSRIIFQRPAKVSLSFLYPIQAGALTFTLDAEMEEDRHLDAKHVIEEAMSRPSSCLTCPIPTLSNSSGPYAQLSKVPEMYATSSTNVSS